MKMPFGKFKGQIVSTLPDNYLQWLISIELWPDLKAEVTKVIRDRQTHQLATPDELAYLALPPAPPQCKCVDDYLTRDDVRAEEWPAFVQVFKPEFAAATNEKEKERLFLLYQKLKKQLLG